MYFKNLNMNSNPGVADRQTDGNQSPLIQKHKMPLTPTGSPTCKGDASPGASSDGMKQRRENVQRLLEKHNLEPKTKRRVSRIPVKAKDFQSRSDVSVSSVDRALQTLRAASEKQYSKIPVRIKDHSCCNCRFNEFLYNLRESIRRLRHLEDVRLKNLLVRLQDQNSKVTAVSESLRSLGDLEKSLKILQTVSTLEQTEESDGAKFPFSTDVDSAEPMRDDRSGNRSRSKISRSTGWLKYALPFLLVLTLTVWREYFSELLCPDIQPDCYLF